MLFVSNRNVTLRSKSGHIIAFKRGEPREVPVPVRREAMAIGIIPVEAGADTVENIEASLARVVPIPADLRHALVFDALHKIREDNDNTKFDAAGRPKVDAVNAYFFGQFSVNANDRTKYWDEYKALVSEGEELPTHKDMAAFLDIAQANSRPEIADFGSMLGVPVEELESVSLRDGRRVLINKLLGG